MATTIKDVFNSTEAAEYVGLTDSLVRRYCREGRIPAERLGRNWYIRKSDLDRFNRKPRKSGNPNFKSR